MTASGSSSLSRATFGLATLDRDSSYGRLF